MVVFRVSCSSSLHNGFDEPELSLAQTPKSVQWALTSDSGCATQKCPLAEPSSFGLSITVLIAADHTNQYSALALGNLI